MSNLRYLVSSAAILVFAAPLCALDLGQNVRFHGFGGWAAGETDGNQYLAGAEGREYDDFSFALAVSAAVSDQLKINAQAFWGSGGGEDVESDIDYAFAEWTFSDALKLRGGLVKHPFGIYTEVFDVGTARPFFHLPQGIYGPAEFIAKAYLGLGLTGNQELASGWGVGYDVYGGEIVLDGTEAANPFLFFGGEPGEGEEEGPEEEEKIKDVLGGRLNFTAPGGALTFGLSAFFGTPEEEGGEEETRTHETYGVHAEYLTNKWSVRLEYAHREGGDEAVEGEAAYLEVAYRLTQHWQLAGRYDQMDLKDEEAIMAGLDPSLQEHRDIAAGLNYWFSPNLVFKLSYHMVEGNLYAIPGESEEPGEIELDDKTKLIQLGLQFSF